MDTYAIKEAQRIIDKRRSDALIKADINLNSLYKRFPKLKEIEDKKRAVTCDFSVKREERKKRIDMFQSQIDDFLKENDIALPQPGFTCSKCRDTGFIGQERCSCFKNILASFSQKENPALKCENFQTFDITVFSPEIRQDIEKIHDYIFAYSSAFPNVKRPNIVLTGECGTGKTFMLNCVYSLLRQRGYSVVYKTAGELFEILRAYAFDKENDFDLLLSVDVLIIDDLGTEPLFNNITVEYIYMLISSRLKNNKANIISTNLSVDKIKERYTERISSRLFDKSISSVIRVPGSDLRMRQNKCN